MTLPVTPTPQLPAQTTREQAYLHQATSANTRRAYQTAVRQFQARGGLLPATEMDIARYLTEQASRLNPRTLSLHLTALSHWHQYQQLPDPTQAPAIRKLMVGIARTHGQPKRKAKAITPSDLQQLLLAASSHPCALRAARDQALLLIAFFGALRRSELVNLQVEHLTFSEQGVIITLPRSKTDQFGEGLSRAIPVGHERLCPVRTLKAWLTLSNVTSGHVFRAITRWGKLENTPLHTDSINTLLKQLADQAGLDGVSELSSHSLRRGFATSAARAGADFTTIKRQGGWQNDATVRGYIEEAGLFEENAAAALLKTLL